MQLDTSYLGMRLPHPFIAGASPLGYHLDTARRPPAASVEDELIEMVRDVKGILNIPLAVKLSPFFTAFANVAHRLDEAGADGLVMFNRFYQPGIDIKTLQVVPRLEL